VFIYTTYPIPRIVEKEEEDSDATYGGSLAVANTTAYGVTTRPSQRLRVMYRSSVTVNPVMGGGA